MSIKLTKNNYEEIVSNSKVPVLIDFYADWCGPCRMAAPVIDQISTELGDKVKVCKVNVDTERDLAESFNVSSIPTFVIIKNNKVANKIVGLRSKQEISKLIAG